MAERVYENFDLLIEQTGPCAYRAKVIAAPAGQTPWVRFQLPFTSGQLRSLLPEPARPDHVRMRDALAPGAHAGGSTPARAIRDLGSALFGRVFDGDVGLAWARSLDLVSARHNGLRLRLRLTDAPELTDVPWEILYSESTGDFLALSEWTPLVRYLDTAHPEESLRVEPPLQILVFTSLPTDLVALDVERERTRLDVALADLVDFGRVHLTHVDSGLYTDLRAALHANDYHVLHYIGHGGYDTVAREGTLAMVDPDGSGHSVDTSADDIAGLLNDHRSLRLVVLNSCQGARGDGQDPFSGTAQSLIRRGLPAVVAMQFAITDEGAIAFAHSLYQALADGDPVDAAVSQVRRAVKVATRSMEWVTPVLYLRALDGLLFDIEAATTAPVTGRATYPPVEVRRLARAVLDCPLLAHATAREALETALTGAVIGAGNATRTFNAWVGEMIEHGRTEALLGALQAAAAGEEQLLGVEEVRQSWVRSQWIAEPLAIFGARLDFQAAITAYRRAVPVGTAARVDSLTDALDAAAQFGRRGQRECPLYRMVAMLEHLGGIRIADGWFELEGDQLAGLRVDGRLAVEESQGRLVIDLRSGGTPPGVPPWPSVVAAYVHRRLSGGWTWVKLRDQQCRPTLTGVQDAVDVHVREARTDLSSFAVGFIVPRLLFSSVPERWPVSLDFDEDSALGLEHPVVLHSGERISLAHLHQKWIQRTNDVRQRLSVGPADIRWIEGALRDNMPAMRQLITQLSAVIALGFVPGATPMDLKGDALLAAVVTGAPCVLWVEDEPPDWVDVRQLVDNLVKAGSMDGLAERLHAERVNSRNPLTGGVRLMWDDPMVLPECLRPGAALRDTLRQGRSLNV